MCMHMVCACLSVWVGVHECMLLCIVCVCVCVCMCVAKSIIIILVSFLFDQGNVLGPLLFLLFINDTYSKLCCLILYTPDDTKCFKTITRPSDHD